MSPGVISPMNPGPYWPLYLWEPLVGGVLNGPPSDRSRQTAKGGSASRPMVARLVLKGTALTRLGVCDVVHVALGSPQ